MTEIFLSYNREDRARAHLFAQGFEAQGLTVWWDTALRSGEDALPADLAFVNLTMANTITKIVIAPRMRPVNAADLSPGCGALTRPAPWS